MHIIYRILVLNLSKQSLIHNDPTSCYLNKSPMRRKKCKRQADHDKSRKIKKQQEMIDIGWRFVAKYGSRNYQRYKQQESRKEY